MIQSVDFLGLEIWKVGKRLLNNQIILNSYRLGIGSEAIEIFDLN